jgi:lactocepin
VDFGFGTITSGFNLTNKAALIQRGTNTFAEKIILAAQAGAAFAIIYNYPSDLPGGGDQLVPMGETDFVPIRAVFIGNSDGEAL